MKKCLLFLFAGLLSFGTFAQTFQWAKSMGSTLNDEGWSIAVDATGNVYSTGFFRGTVDFNPGAAVSNLTSAGDA